MEEVAIQQPDIILSLSIVALIVYLTRRRIHQRYQGDYCHPDLAKLLISQPLIDDYNLSGAEHLNTDVLVIGGGGAGAAAALSATEAGARVIMANKLRIGDSNTVMAEGGIQAAVGAEDSLQNIFTASLSLLKRGWIL